MKKRLLSLLFAVCANAFAQSDSGIDMRLVEQAKAAGAQGAGIASQQFIEFDANGDPKLDMTGKPIMRDNGPSAMKDSLNTFQKITGTTGVEQVANPAHSGRTGLAKVRVNQSLDVSCVGSNAIPGSVAAGGLVLKLGVCEKNSGGQVSAIQVSVCGESAKGGLCAQASDYSSPVRVTVGAYSNLSGLSVGVGCNVQNKCLVSFMGSYSFGGNDESLKGDVAQAASQSNVLSGLKKVVVEDDYAGKMREIGQPLADCAEANRVLSADGKYMTCDGSKQVTVQGPTETGECSGATRECLREAVDIQTYNRSCVRTFPLTQRISQLEYTRTQDCEIIEYYKPEYGTSSNSCTPAQTSGMTRIGSVTETCAVKTTIKKLVNGKEVTEEICAADKRIEYNADVSNPVVRGVTETPSKVGGTCDVRAGSETKTLQCAGTWYGRTLPSNECTGSYIDEWNNSTTGTLQLLYADKPGCGLCLQPQIGQTCYAVPSPNISDPVTADREDDCSAIDTSICRLVSSTPQTYTGQGGLVSSQRDTFECKKETRHCVQWGAGKGDAACLKSD
ncbi:hypothetical protein LC612_30095, partial [Nostoc sp. CHAB 5834]|nr:hypothetical protein [Nostoc sp. CHAB 5834]